MASWRENKVLGIVAAVILVVCVILVVKAIIGMKPARVPSAGEQIRQMGGV